MNQLLGLKTGTIFSLLLVATGSEWIAWSENNDTAESICQVPTKMKIQEDTQLVFTSKNISSLQFIWSAQDGSKDSKQVNDSYVGGFKLEWHIDGPNGLIQESNRQGISFWKFKRCDEVPTENAKRIRTVMSLVREAKKHKVSEKDIWNSVLARRWNINILKRAVPCLTKYQW